MFTVEERERQSQIDEARRLANQNPKYKDQKDRLKGHEAFLDALKANKTKCKFLTTGGLVFTGTIEHLDSDTISIMNEATKLPECIFKANLTSFAPLHLSPKAKQ